jgi:hypothetical protein
MRNAYKIYVSKPEGKRLIGGLLEQDPLSLVSTIEERKSSSSGLESPEYGHGDPSR